MTVIVQIIIELFKKLCRSVGPAMILLALLAAAVLIVPRVTEKQAVRDALKREANEVLTFEEVRYDAEKRDRVFRVKIKNSTARPLVYASLYITAEDGKIIYNSVRGEFHDMLVADRNVGMSDFVPPGSECVLDVYIDDFYINGIDHLYVSDLYSKENQGRRFEIERAEYKNGEKVG